ncbi:chorismate synthase, partial [Alistipes putredinis]|nr:chorismate synthase [Alistipes putredinis]
SNVMDEIFYNDEKGIYRGSNRLGGIEGGMTTGDEIVVRCAMKPIPTLYKPLNSINMKTLESFQATVERSDTCAVPACSVVCENVVA